MGCHRKKNSSAPAISILVEAAAAAPAPAAAAATTTRSAAVLHEHWHLATLGRTCALLEATGGTKQAKRHQARSAQRRARGIARGGTSQHDTHPTAELRNAAEQQRRQLVGTDCKLTHGGILRKYHHVELSQQPLVGGKFCHPAECQVLHGDGK